MRSEGNGVRSEGNVVTCRIAGQSLSRQAKPATLMSRGFMRHSPLPGRSRGPTFLCPLAGTDSTACCCEVDWLWGCLCRRLYTRVHVRMRDDEKARPDTTNQTTSRSHRPGYCGPCSASCERRLFDGGCGRRERVMPCSMSAAGGRVAGCCVSTAPLVLGNGFEGLALVPVIEVEGVGRGSFRGLPAEARGPPGSDGALAFADKDGSETTGPRRAEATEPVMPSKTSEKIRRGLATRSSSCRACCPAQAFLPASPGGGLTGFGIMDGLYTAVKLKIPLKRLNSISATLWM